MFARVSCACVQVRDKGGGKQREMVLSLNKTFVSSAHQRLLSALSCLCLIYSPLLAVFLFHSPAALGPLASESTAELKPGHFNPRRSEHVAQQRLPAITGRPMRTASINMSADNVDRAPGSAEKKKRKES